MPIFISVNFVLKTEGKEKRLCFCVILFGFINIFSGYAETKKEGIYVHYKTKKAFLIKYFSAMKMRGGLKPFNDYHILRLRLITEIGFNDEIILPMIAANFLNQINNLFYIFLMNNKPYFNFNHDVNLIEGEKFLNILGKTTIVFNILTVILSVIKIIIGKIKNEKS